MRVLFIVFIRLNLFYYLSLYCRNVRNSLVVIVVRPRQRVSSRGSFYQANGTWLHLGLFRNNIQSTRTISLYIVFSFVTCFHLIKFINRLEWYPGNRYWLRYPFGLALRHILPKIGAFILFLLSCLHSSVVRYSHLYNLKKKFIFVFMVHVDTSQLKLDKTGFLSAIPYLAMAIVVQCGGQLADWLRSRWSVQTTKVFFNCKLFLTDIQFDFSLIGP